MKFCCGSAAKKSNLQIATKCDEVQIKPRLLKKKTGQHQNCDLSIHVKQFKKKCQLVKNQKHVPYV